MVFSSNKRSWLTISVLVITLSLIHISIRAHVTQLPYFHNEDVAGITYSADLLLNQKLPLVDTIEMKAPGSFFIVAYFWSIFDRSIQSAQALGIFWSLCAMLNIFWGTLLLSRRRWIAYVSALLYLGYAPFLDSIDINYSAWMVMPYLLSFNLALWAWTRSHKSSLQNKRIITYLIWFLSGVVLSWAALCKRQAAVLTPVLAYLAYQADQIEDPHQKSKQRYSSLLMGVVGVISGFLPMIIYYSSHGHGMDFMRHYFLSESGWKYVSGGASGGLTWTDKLPRLLDGVIGVWFHAGGLTILMIACLYWICIHNKKTLLDIEKKMGITLLLAWCMSFLGTSLGWRFFKGYYIQLLPFCIYIIAWGVSHYIHHRRDQDMPKKHIIIYALFFVSMIASLPQDIKHFQYARNTRKHALYPPTRDAYRIGQWIHKNTSTQDKIWIWGRWAWPVYFYSQRESATRYFKSLGVLTTQLSNTWNPQRKTRPTGFNPQGPWKQAINELRKKLPKVIVLARNEPYHKFTALRQLLSQHYHSITHKLFQQKRRKKGNQRRPQYFTIYQRKQ